jgi:H+/Cl- antiporter ClcA
MKRRLAEETVLFISIIKWVTLAAIIGILSGFSTTYFLKLLAWSINKVTQYPYDFLLLPFALFLSGLLIQYLAPEAEGQGTDRVIEAIHKHSGRIRPIVIPVKLVATVVTIAAGGSAGKIGPCAQIGGGLASLFAEIFRFGDSDRKKLVICGISAGFASVFGTPIAGAIFGVEVLFVGSVLYEVLLPSFVAGMVSFQVASSLGTTYFHNPIRFRPVFSESFMLEVVVAGIFFGICSFALVETLRYGKRASDRIPGSLPWKGLMGGAMLIILVLIFSRQFLGLGFETIQSAILGKEIPWYAFFLKMVFTSITLNFGGSGGIVVPILFIGSTAGSFYGSLIGEDPATFSSLGFAALLAGATNTPLASSILALELFGGELAPYAALSCIISFLMTGHRSVHATQVLAIQKSASLRVKIGREVEEVEIAYQPREKSVISLLASFIQRLRNRKNRDRV